MEKLQHQCRACKVLGPESSLIRPRFGIIVLLACVAFFSCALDQWTKYLVVKNLTLGEVVPVFGEFVQFVYVTNSGAAFSLGNTYTWVFSLLAFSVTVLIVWFSPRIRSLSWAIVGGLLLGGVLGNLIDRLFRGSLFGFGNVVDFLKIPVLPAIFNLADVAICVSMALFLILTIRGVRLDGSSPPQKPTTSSQS